MKGKKAHFRFFDAGQDFMRGDQTGSKRGFEAVKSVNREVLLDEKKKSSSFKAMTKNVAKSFLRSTCCWDEDCISY